MGGGNPLESSAVTPGRYLVRVGTSVGGDVMAKGQVNPGKSNKPKLTTKEKQARKKLKRESKDR
jgi:hypothetical protein